MKPTTIKSLCIAIIVLFGNVSLALAQSTEAVTIIKHDGDTLNFVTTLRKYKGQNIFPDDDKPFIKGQMNGGKIQLQKSEISKIILSDKTEYEVLNNLGMTYYIGFFVTKGNINVFKAYTYGRTTAYTPSGAQATMNKTASVTYYLYKKGILSQFDRKKGFNDMATNCPDFKNYLDKQNFKKDEEAEKAFIYYNDSCK